MKRMFERKIAVSAALTLAALAAARQASAAPITISADYSGWVAYGGKYVYTSSSKTDTLVAGYATPGNSGVFAFVEFTGLPSTPVQQATLQLNVYSVENSSATPVAGTGYIGAYSAKANVTSITNLSTTTTFINNDIGTIEDSASLTSASATTGLGTIITLDVTDIVNGWITSGNNYGMVLAAPSSSDNLLWVYGTGATGVAPDGTPPVITAVVPEPASLSVLACAAGGLLVRRKRQA